MRLFAVFVIAASSSACTNQDRAAHGNTDSAAPVESLIVARPDSAAPAEPASVDPVDALLDTILPARPAVIATGDTVESFGGSMMDTSYAVAHYRKNSAQFFRIDQSTGHRPDGKAIWRTITHVSLPVLKKEEQFMHGGMCGTGDKGEPYILAVVTAKAEQVEWKDVSRAWRFDRASETVKEIDPKQVTCWNPGDD